MKPSLPAQIHSPVGTTSSQSAKIQAARMLRNRTMVLPLPFRAAPKSDGGGIRVEGRGEGLVQLRGPFIGRGWSLSSWLIVIVSLGLLLGTTGCRRDMFEQPISKPLRRSDFFQDNHMASRPLVPNTIARGHLDADTVFYSGKIGTNLVQTLPIAINAAVLDRGRERFNIYCSPCHARTGQGNGMIVQRGFPPPPSFHIDRLREAPVGHFFDVITQGYGIMYSYANRVEPADRWAIAAYIRALQRSYNARLTDLRPEEAAKLAQAKPDARP